MPPMPLPLTSQVVGSREKAKEMHSSLALQPSRKVQREASPNPNPNPSPNPNPNPNHKPNLNQVQRGGEEGVDMQHVIRTLRAKGVGAHCATAPRGLDAVVAEAIELCDASAPVHAAPTESAPASAPAGSLLSARVMGLSASRQLVSTPAEGRKRRGEVDSAAGREVKRSRGQGVLVEGCGGGENGGGGGGGGGKGVCIDEAEVFGICTRNATRTLRGTCSSPPLPNPRARVSVSVTAAVASLALPHDGDYMPCSAGRWRVPGHCGITACLREGG